MDKNLYDLPAEELADIPTVCGSCGSNRRTPEGSRLSSSWQCFHQRPN